MSPEQFVRRILDPSLCIASDLIAISITPEARVLLMAIAGQESGLYARWQIGAPQYGRGFWMFERNGITGVATHQASAEKLGLLCAGLMIPEVLPQIHNAIAWNDVLAVGMARLLLFTDTAAIPAIGQEEAAWDMYLRNWRPGTPREEHWPTNYQTAVDTCG